MAGQGHGGSRPRLLLLSTAGGVGGMERVVCTLARGFRAREWHVDSVFPATPAAEAHLRWCGAQGVEAEVSRAVLELVAPHGWAEMAALRGLVRSRRPDVVNLHYGSGFISLKDVIAVRGAGAQRLFVTVHHPEPRLSMRKRALTLVAAALTRRVVAVSHSVARVLREARLPGSWIEVIPNGVAAPAYRIGRDEARRRLGIPEGALVVGTLARLEPHKRIADLVVAAARLVPEHPRLLLLIGGDGSERGHIEALATRELPGRARLLGFVEREHEVYASLDVFALPSQLEGFGLVFVEAALHGVPSVGADTGGVPEVILADRTGLLVPAGSVDALAGALDRLARDPALRSRLGEAARQRALQELTERRMVDDYAKVFAG